MEEIAEDLFLVNTVCPALYLLDAREGSCEKIRGGEKLVTSRWARNCPGTFNYSPLCRLGGALIAIADAGESSLVDPNDNVKKTWIMHPRVVLLEPRDY